MKMINGLDNLVLKLYLLKKRKMLLGLLSINNYAKKIQLVILF